MKVVYLYDAIARIGGIERVMISKMNYLADISNYEIYLITTAQGTHPYAFPLSAKVKHIDLNIRSHIQYQYSFPKRIWIKWQMNKKLERSLQSQIEEIDPDIIVGTTYYGANLICQLKHRAKKIIESHSAKSYTEKYDIPKHNVLLQWIYNSQRAKYNRIIEEKSDILVTLTSGDAREWSNAHSVFIIPNMITSIPNQSSSCEIRRVITAGRLTFQKGYDRLIDTWKLVYEKHPNWRLDIFGTGDLQNDLLKQIDNNNLNNVITIHPPTSNIHNELEKSSIFVLTSHYEGFALVLAEAMSCGIPCVSFDCPYGPSDIIKDGVDGMLIETGNIKALSDAICRLIENENMRKEFGRRAKENIKCFLPEAIIPQWTELFNTLTKQ